MQFRNEWFSLSSHVDVFSYNSTGAPMGQWEDLNIFFTKRYSFIDFRGGEETMLQANTPWGIYMGMRYDLWRCGGPEEDTFHFVEDIWARPFFNWNAEKVLDIARGTQHVGRSTSRKNDRLFGSLYSSKEIIVTDTQDQTIATIRQESQLEAGFQNRRYFTENHRPDIIPNEVVSFLAGVWELNGVSEKSESHSTSTYHSSSRRR